MHDVYFVTLCAIIYENEMYKSEFDGGIIMCGMTTDL